MSTPTPTAADQDAPLVSVDHLSVDFADGDGWSKVLQDVTLDIGREEAVGLVGESGCGKTTAAYALLGFRRPGSRIQCGTVRLEGQDLLTASANDLRRVRGGEIGFVPQNPTVTLNPRIRVGQQLEETLRHHDVGGSRKARYARVRDLLGRVGLPQGLQAGQAYPHQLSGGQQQRVMIAMALACEPKLVVLDEPTTGLDVTTQAQILRLLEEIRSASHTALLYVTHDLSVIEQVCDRVCVMYAGRIVEDASVAELFGQPRHPYTRGLIGAVPTIGGGTRVPAERLHGLLRRSELPHGCPFAPRCPFAMPRCFEEVQELEQANPGHLVACWRWGEIEPISSNDQVQGGPRAIVDGDPLLTTDHLSCAYGHHGFPFGSRRRARDLVVRDVSLELRAGETLALVGESGSGKSTIARSLAGLLPPVAGGLTYQGRPLRWPTRGRSRTSLREIQIVLQNPDASLNPRNKVGDVIGRPLELYFGMRGANRDGRVTELLDEVRLDPGFARRYPEELSGGERQRVAIARALAAQPKVMLCDEILSALDVSVQAEILDLMRELQARERIAYLFISHDLAVVRSLAHRVAVLYRGELCEIGTAEDVFAPPYHPYTHLLLSSIPGSRLATSPTRGHAVESINEHGTVGCPFTPRCALKVGEICEGVSPPWHHVSPTHAIRCHVPVDELRNQASMADPELERAVTPEVHNQEH